MTNLETNMRKWMLEIKTSKSAQDIMKRFDISQHTAHRICQQMVNEGILQIIMDGRKYRYVKRRDYEPNRQIPEDKRTATVGQAAAPSGKRIYVDGRLVAGGGIHLTGPRPSGSWNYHGSGEAN